MKSVYALTLPIGSADLFEEPAKSFGTVAIDTFPSIQFDVEEAGKCLALGRYTASVFHCMRIMEVGLEALGGALGLKIATNWNNALNLIEKEIRSRSTTTTERVGGG